MTPRVYAALARAARIVAEAFEEEARAEDAPTSRRQPTAPRLPALPDEPPTELDRARAQGALRRKGVA
jgi:hypothetical protein